MDENTWPYPSPVPDSKTGESSPEGRKTKAEAMFKQAQLLFDLHRLYVDVTFGRNHVRVRKDSKSVAANFQNVNIDLFSPAFVSPYTVSEEFQHGRANPTSDLEMDRFLASVGNRNNWATYKTLEFQSEDDRPLPMLLLSESPRSTSRKELNRKKIRLWIQAAVHGNEPASDQGLLALVGKMNADQVWAASLLDKMDIAILPRYNPDGVACFQRAGLSQLDLNRDHIKMACQQTRNIKKVFSSFAPHVAVDMHEYKPTTPYHGVYQQGCDGLYSAAKNLNIHPSIRRMAEELFAPALSNDLKSAGLRGEPYVTGEAVGSAIVLTEAGSDAKIGRNAMGLTQCITFLTESRGIGVADQAFQRRTAASLTMVKSIVQTIADNAEKICNTVEAAVSDFCASDADIVITDSPLSQNRAFTMVNVQSGEIEEVPVRFLSSTPTVSTLTRARPAAYLIPRTWHQLASRLEDLGVHVDTLSTTFHGIVQVYTITAVSMKDTYFEGIVPVSVSCEITTTEVTLEAGAHWVTTRQKNAALAFVAIEPENRDSWVSLNIIPVEVGYQLPVFRIMS